MESVEKRLKIERILDQNPVHLAPSGMRYFLHPSPTVVLPSSEGIQKTLQAFLRRFGTLYRGLVQFLGPASTSRVARRKNKALLARYQNQHVILQIGSGPGVAFARRDAINLDIAPLDQVDIVANAEKLPIKDDCVDLIVNIAMLEHVPHPALVVSEMYRVLKNQGCILAFVPFMQPLHAAPSDYQRWTREGLKVLFSKFNNVEIVIGSGPTSGMLWILQEWIALVLSFGNRTLRDIVFLVTMVLTAPLKAFDLVLSSHPDAERTAGGFFIYASKKGD